MDFAIDGEELSRAAGKLADLGSDMDLQLDVLDRVMRNTAGKSWTGSASDEFAVVYLEWLESARAAAAGLQLLSGGVMDAGASYDKAEEAIRASFLGADGAE